MTAFNENCLFLFGAPRAPLAVRRASLREWGPQWGTGGGPTQGRAALAANQSRVHPFGGYAKVYNNEVIVAQFKSSPVYLTSAVDGKGRRDLLSLRSRLILKTNAQGYKEDGKCVPVQRRQLGKD